MNNLVHNFISKEDFCKIKEEDVLFITNPGRMGDEDGTTFVVNKDGKYVIYRVDGWMYPNKDINRSECITLDDASKQFPEWYETWKCSNDINYKGKYKYLYMGFGNGLCVDNSIYGKYKPYLEEVLEKNLQQYDDKEGMKYAVIFSVWEEALSNMIKGEKV